MTLRFHRFQRRFGWFLSAIALSVITATDLVIPEKLVSQPVVTNSCLGSADPKTVAIAWEKIKNPIISFPEQAAKDMTVRFVDGKWQMLFSYISDNPFRFQIGGVNSTDLSDWSTDDVKVWDRSVSGGLASPEVVQAPDGRYVTVFNSHTYDLRSLSRNKLYYRTSSDFQIWNTMNRLGEKAWSAPEDRLIDAAIAYTEAGIIVVAKKEQTPYFAISTSGSLDGPWKEIGKPNFASLENYQLLQIDGVWHLLGTTLRQPKGYDRAHLPALYRLIGNPSDPQGWLEWERVGILDVPQESWNQGYERANSAHLCDARAADGYFYLFYAGSNDRDSFNGRGHAKIGVARSRDLKNWSIPGQP